MMVPQKFKCRITIWPRNSTSWYILKRIESRDSDFCTPMFISRLFIVVNWWKQNKCSSVNEWICKMWYIHTLECYSVLEGNSKMCYHMDEPWRHLFWSFSDQKANPFHVLLSSLLFWYLPFRGHLATFVIFCIFCFLIDYKPLWESTFSHSPQSTMMCFWQVTREINVSLGGVRLGWEGGLY